MWKSEPITNTQAKTDGEYGEEQARLYLKNKGFNLIQLDWCGFKDGKLTVFEIKYKKRFTPPPFYGHGLDLRQVRSRKRLLEETGLRTFFMVLDKEDGHWYVQWLDVLEKKEYFDTRNGVRIYRLDNFIKMPNFTDHSDSS